MIHAVEKNSQKGFNVSTATHLTLLLTFPHNNQSIAQARHVGIRLKRLLVKLLYSFTGVRVVDNPCNLGTRIFVPKAAVKLIDSGSRHTKPIYRKCTLTQMHLTPVLNRTYVLYLFASHPLQPTMRHLAITRAGLIPNSPTILFTPSLLNSPSSNWISHWHVPHHAVQIQKIGIHCQYTVTKLARISVLSRVQTSQARLVVSLVHNAGTNKISTHQ